MKGVTRATDYLDKKLSVAFESTILLRDNFTIENFCLLQSSCHGRSGCGSVGRAVAFNTRGPRFDSSHRQIYVEHLFVYCIEKTKINKKRPQMAHFLSKKVHVMQIVMLSRLFHLPIPIRGYKVIQIIGLTSPNIAKKISANCVALT